MLKSFLYADIATLELESENIITLALKATKNEEDDIQQDTFKFSVRQVLFHNKSKSDEIIGLVREYSMNSIGRIDSKVRGLILLFRQKR